VLLLQHSISHSPLAALGTRFPSVVSGKRPPLHLLQLRQAQEHLKAGLQWANGRNVEARQRLWPRLCIPCAGGAALVVFRLVLAALQANCFMWAGG
jgi:hypothetical protein